MTTSPQHDGSSDGAPAVANLGLVRPPLVYLSSVVAGTVLDIVWPLAIPRCNRLIATLIAAVALMALVVIPREERYLEGKFGAEYLDYKAAVRRWL